MAAKSSSLPGVGLAGAGYWGKNLLRNFHELKALRCVCDSDPETVRSLRKSHPHLPLLSSYEQLLARRDVRAVAIATPAQTHYELARAALLAGKDVFVEKPLSLSVENGSALVELAEKRKRILMVGHLLWYHPAVLKLKKMADAGELGRIRYIYSNRLNLGRVRREENILWSFAPHDISVILGLLGEEPNDIQALAGNYLHEQIADTTVTLLGFPSGVKAHIFVSWLHPFKDHKLVVVGEKKMAVFDDGEPERKLAVYPHEVEWRGQIPVLTKAKAEYVPVASSEPLREECAHFLQCVADRAAPRTDGREGLRVLKTLQACQRAIERPPGKGARRFSAERNGVFVHESSEIDENVRIGKGTKIWHFSHVLKNSSIGENCNVGQNVVVGPNVRIGRGVKIQNNVSVYEGVTLEDEVFCGPSMVFTNVFNPRAGIRRMHELKPTLVRRGATIGANATILCGVEIGRYAFIGAGAVVTRNVPDHALMTGVPARASGWMCACGLKLSVRSGKAACACGKRYKKILGGLKELPGPSASG